jgi:hypothetical protein
MSNRKKSLAALAATVLCLILLAGAGPGRSFAEPPAAPGSPPATGAPADPSYSVRTVTLPDGTQASLMTIHGPSKPPSDYELERAPVAPSDLNRPGASTTLSVPAYKWVFGPSATSAAMIGAYFDRNGFPDIYTGPANGGVMPMDDTVWPTWTDGASATYPGNPLVASRQGTDGRTTKGTIDDYWIAKGSTDPDPYITGVWTQHTWGDALGDYMKTSQSAHGLEDGRELGYWSYSDGRPETCSEMQSWQAETDAGYGRKLFYEARGYAVSECYNRTTDNQVAGGFSFADYKAQIDAGHPVLLLLSGDAGNAVAGVGYADPNTVYLHDTWDYQTHQMTWGGSYAGETLYAVSVVNPSEGGRVYLPLALRNDSSVAGWTTIVSTNFEGTWPGPWQVFDRNGATDGEYTWGKRSCRVYAGSNSGWGVGAGAQGASLGCGAVYPNNAESWMLYGPFSLADATAAELRFKLWLDTEINYDWVCRLASVEGDTDFDGSCTSGDSDGWIDMSLDLASLPTLGSLLGQPQVWVALVFVSDGSTTYPEGGYVDNVVLRKCPTGAMCPAASSPTLVPGSQVVESPARMRLVR